MKIEWGDLEMIEDGILSSDCWLDSTSGRFTDHATRGYPLLQSVWPRPEERAAWGASMYEPETATVVRARFIMKALRARREIVGERTDRDVAERLLRVLDAEGSPEQAEAVEAFAASRRKLDAATRVRETYASLLKRAVDRDDAILWAMHHDSFAADEHELAALRLRVFDFALERAAPAAFEALQDWERLAHKSAVWEWAARLPERPSNDPPWLADVDAWREEEQRRKHGRVARLVARLDHAIATQAPALHASLRPGVSNADDRFGAWLPPELVQLWAWRDGGGEIVPVGFGYTLHSVDEARAVRDEGKAAFAANPEWWSPTWIPFLRDPSGNSIVLGEFAGESHQVLGFWHDDPDRDVLAYDVEGLLDVLVAMYEAKLFESADGELRCASMWDYSVFWRRRNGIRHPTFRVDSSR